MMKKRMRQYTVYVKGGSEENRQLVLKEFSKMLDCQIEKIVIFFIEQQGHLVSNLKDLGEERDLVKRSGELCRIHELQEAYKMVGNSLLKLLIFVETNATGLRKILKKFDKHVGYRLTDYYVTSRSNHPYSQLKQVFRHVGVGALVATLSRGLAELQSRTESFTVYDGPHLELPYEDPLIKSIREAEARLTNSTSFLEFLGAHALIEYDDIPTVEEENVEFQYHFMSLVLNLANTFLYMVNTYIVVPTADKYALRLGAAATVCGTIIGAMAVAQLVSSVYFSAWSNRSYYKPLVFSSIFLFLGNILYAVAYDLGSLPILLAGRILCGLGSARAVNRRYISDWVPVGKRLRASAAFVSASALGMAAGPALAGFFGMNESILCFTFNANTLPGWFMAACWCVYLIWLCISFQEPVQQQEKVEEKDKDPESIQEVSTNTSREHAKSKVERRLKEPLLLTSENLDDDGNDAEIDNNDDPEDSHKPASSIMEAYALLTTPVKVQLLIYFMLKYALEVLLSESSVVTDFYFNWTTQSVALFLALLGLTVLPINIIVGNYISNMFEDRQILFATELMTCLGLCISFAWRGHYTLGKYVSGALITFVSAEVLEGVNLSLLSKVMSSRLARGTYNNGLLSTEAGTLARVLADATITLAGFLGPSYLLNVTLVPSLLIGILSVIATCYTYNSLF